jgi:hypothetical protein
VRLTTLSILTYLVFVLVGCAERDDGNLYLACKGTRSIHVASDTQDLGTETKPYNYSFEFLNKGLKDIECQVWSPDAIKCKNILANNNYKKTTTIEIDRKSGTFFVSVREINNSSVIEETGEGTCEKIEKNKI